jgi:hypothetical protein
MRTLFGLAILAVIAVACHRDTRAPVATAAKTNVVSRLDDRGRPMETILYTTNGAVQRRTFFETGDDGRILSARTVDAEGELKWTDKYTYEAGTNQRPIEVQRVKPNGEAVVVKFVYLPDGTERRIVIGPNGELIPDADGTALEK